MILERNAYKNHPGDTQPRVFRSNEHLLWPLTVPWPNSFVTSSNPARDFPRHGVFAAIEVDIVDRYRQKMIYASPEIGKLRRDILDILAHYNTLDDPYRFPDGLITPEKDGYGEKVDENIDEFLRAQRLSASFKRYTSEVEEIMKFCGKQSVMLGHPSGSKDSIVVREIFDEFIEVSG